MLTGVSCRIYEHRFSRGDKNEGRSSIQRSWVDRCPFSVVLVRYAGSSLSSSETNAPLTVHGRRVEGAGAAECENTAEVDCCEGLGTKGTTEVGGEEGRLPD